MKNTDNYQENRNIEICKTNNVELVKYLGNEIIFDNMYQQALVAKESTADYEDLCKALEENDTFRQRFETFGQTVSICNNTIDACMSAPFEFKPNSK